MTYQSEKFCLKWKDFQQNIVNSFQDLRNDSEVSDVTLVCDGGQQIEAHRIILTRSSACFSSILKLNKHSHPIIYMKGLKEKDLGTILDFIYNGEANVYQEDLNGFLSLAAELQLKGLDVSKQEAEQPIQYPQNRNANKLTIPKQEANVYPNSPVKKVNEKLFPDSSMANSDFNYIYPVDDDNIRSPSKTGEFKDKIESMIERATGEDYKFKCNVCGKTTTAKQIMDYHVETHIEGLSYPCKICGKCFRSRNSKIVHVSKQHRK